MILDRTKGWIGVDVGTHAVKLAQIARSGSSYSIHEAAIVQRAEPWPDPERLATAPQESGGEILAARALGQNFCGSSAAATMSMAICQLRNLQIVEASDTVQRTTIARELAQTTHSGEGDLEFDFWPITHEPESGKMVRENVSTLAIASRWASRLAQDHRAAKLNCRLLDGTPLALARAVRMVTRGAAGKPIAALDWGFTGTTFCVVVDGRPIFVRSLRDCGFGNVLSALRTALSISWDEARKLAFEYGVAGTRAKVNQDDSRSVVAEIIEPSVTVLVEELQRTLTYLQTHRSALAPSQLWLFGGGALMNGINSVLGRHLSLKVSPWALNDDTFRSDTAGISPAPLLGTAIALSALAWEQR